MHLRHEFVFLCQQEKLWRFTGAICQTLLLLPTQLRLFLLLYIHQLLWESLHQLNLSMFWNTMLILHFFNLDVSRWCVGMEQSIVNFYINCIVKFPLFTCEFWMQIFAFPWWISVFLLCWSPFCPCFSSCNFLWINATIEWVHEIKSADFPLPFDFYE